MSELFATILGKKVFAVTGYSLDTAKFGNIVYWFMRRAGYEVYAVNPTVEFVQGDERCYPSVAELPVKPDCVVTVTQPWITSGILKNCVDAGVPYVWMQPGSEPRAGIEEAGAAGVEIVQGGPCIMVEHRRVGKPPSS